MGDENPIQAEIKALRDELETFKRGIAVVRIAAPPAEGTVSSGKPAVGLLRFQQGMLVFASAIIAALFAGWPKSDFTETYWLFGRYLVGRDALAWVLEWLVCCVILGTVTAILTQINRDGVETLGKGRGLGLTVLTVGSAAFGFLAALPFVFGAFRHAYRLIFC